MKLNSNLQMKSTGQALPKRKLKALESDANSRRGSKLLEYVQRNLHPSHSTKNIAKYKYISYFTVRQRFAKAEICEMNHSYHAHYHC